MTRWSIVLLAIVALAMGACDDGPIAPPPTATMDWALFDQCDDGLGLQAALFDTTTGRVYPSSSSVYVSSPGGVIDVRIECRLGAQVCYGAETDPPSSVFWGVGLDGNAGCNDCCDVCNDNIVEFDLLCGGTFSPGTKSADGAKTQAPARRRQ
ncbi:MAG: hypothetical protein AAGD38_14820 [Acidobacteriota bacterium]